MSNTDHKAAMITAIRAGGPERERAFRFFEEKTAASFKGPGGAKFFNDLYVIAKEADPTATEEYAKRFTPLLDDDARAKVLLESFSDALAETVQEKEADLAEKQALVTFLDRVEKCSVEELGPLIEDTIASHSPRQLKVIMTVMALAIRKKSSRLPTCGQRPRGVILQRAGPRSSAG